MVKLWFGALSNYGTVRGEHGGIVGGQHDKKKKKRGMELLSNVSPAQVAGAGGRFVQRREYKKSRPFVENEY